MKASQDNSLYFCTELPTHPKPELGKILITGSTGYIGGRLVPELLHRGYNIRILVRAHSDELTDRFPNCEIVIGDVLKKETLYAALEGIHTAYYLIHSFLLGKNNFESADHKAAKTFRDVAADQNIRRIIYLSGLGNTQLNLSPHLRSRTDVAEAFQSGRVPTIILRAAIIIGSGSASYEIIKHLVKNAPIILMPPWARTRCQPISVRDVIKYLVGILESNIDEHRTFDIGGSDILTYQEMLKIQAEVAGNNYISIPSPFNLRRTCTYVASLITPVPAPITRCLMGSVMNEVVCNNQEIQHYLPFETVSYRDSLLKANNLERENKINTRWSDAYPPAFELAEHLKAKPHQPDYQSEYFVKTNKEAYSIFNTFCNIGGKQGWFHYNWMWRLRGYIDRIFLGVGSSRGRKNTGKLRVNDVLDFWRVEDIKANQLLLLRAEMKLPGQAWLRFAIHEKEGIRTLSVKTYFYVDSLWGRIYWFMFLPFHYFIFKSLLKQIELRS